MKKFKEQKLFILLAVIPVLLIHVFPMLSMLLRSFIGDQGLTLEYFGKVFADPKNAEALWNTFVVSTLSTILSLFLGTALAVLLQRTDVRWQKWIKALILVPLFVPPFVYAMGWQQMFNPAGYMNKLYQSIAGPDQILFNIYGPVGIIIVMATANMSQVFLLLENGIQKMDSSLEEAARISGAKPHQVLRTITLPVMLPNLLAAALMSFITSISNFGIPAVLGFQVSYNVMTTRIYKVLQSFYITDNFNLASAMAVILLLFAIISLKLKEIALRQRSFSSTRASRAPETRQALGKWRTPASFLILLVLFFSSVLPLLAILLTALTKAYGKMPWGENLTLDNFKMVWELSLVKRSVMNSFMLSIFAATIAVILGILIAYILNRSDFRFKNALDLSVAIPYSIPGTIVGLAIILSFGRNLFGFSLYNSFSIILIAYLARYLFFSVRSLSAAMSRISPSLEEAARVSGATRFGSIRDILLPQVRNDAVSSWIIIFAHTISELTVSILLWSVGHETVAVAVFNLQDAGNIVASCALAVILLIITFISYYLAEWISKRQAMHAKTQSTRG